MSPCAVVYGRSVIYANRVYESSFMVVETPFPWALGLISPFSAEYIRSSAAASRKSLAFWVLKMRICAICHPLREGFVLSFKPARAFLATSWMSAVLSVASTWRQLSSSLPSAFWRLRRCGRALQAREPASSSVVRRLESWQSPWVADRPSA